VKSLIPVRSVCALLIVAGCASPLKAQGSMRWYFKKRTRIDTVATDSLTKPVANAMFARLLMDSTKADSLVEQLSMLGATTERIGATSTDKSGVRRALEVQPLRGQAKMLSVRNIRTNTTVWAGPSIGFDAFVRESGTGQYRTGIIPGVGYGVKWGKESPNSKPWIALDLFVQGAVSEENKEHEGSDYFNIDVLPVVTLFDWVSVGYGPRFKTGLGGLASDRRNLFSFGVRKATP
jgi:hypothetical protein